MTFVLYLVYFVLHVRVHDHKLIQVDIISIYYKEMRILSSIRSAHSVDAGMGYIITGLLFALLK